jgi:hypothetical protein
MKKGHKISLIIFAIVAVILFLTSLFREYEFEQEVMSWNIYGVVNSINKDEKGFLYVTIDKKVYYFESSWGALYLELEQGDSIVKKTNEHALKVFDKSDKNQCRIYP